MVLTRAALEKKTKQTNKEEHNIISLSVKNDDKLKSNMANLINQLAEVNKTLERRESQLRIFKTINNALEKRITSLKKQCWKNEQYSLGEWVEIVGFLTHLKKQLIEKVTGLNVNQVCLEPCLHSQVEKMLTVSYKRKRK